MTRIFPYLTMAVVFFTIPLTANASDAFKYIDSIKTQYETKFKPIKAFGDVRLFTQGSAEKIGLTEEELTTYLKLAIKNNFAGMKIYEQPVAACEGLAKKKCVLDDVINDYGPQIGTFRMDVWTVGENFPVAYHISFKFSNWDANWRDKTSYENSTLGYGSKENVPRTVKETINSLVEEMAMIFFKVRGEI